VDVIESIADLRAELKLLDETIMALQRLATGRGTTSAVGGRKPGRPKTTTKRGRRPRTPEQRAAQAERMKACWSKKKAAQN
jgi:hypothetical protein